MCCTMIASYRALFPNCLSHCIAFVVTHSETYRSHTGFSAKMEKSSTSRPGRKEDNPALAWYSEKGIFHLHLSVFPENDSHEYKVP